MDSRQVAMNGPFLLLRFREASAALILSLLASCAMQEPIVTAVPVSVPLVAPCRVATPEVPAWPVSVLARDATLFEQVRAALGEIEARRAYESELEAAVKACR